MREFWEGVSSALPSLPTPDSDWAREWSHMAAAGQVMTFGVPGFFTPRFPPPAFAERQTPEAVSFYDTAPLAATLDRLVDWDRVNNGKVRLSVRSEEHTSELQSLMRISYAVFCLKKKNK